MTIVNYKAKFDSVSFHFFTKHPPPFHFLPTGLMSFGLRTGPGPKNHVLGARVQARISQMKGAIFLEGKEGNPLTRPVTE